MDSPKFHIKVTVEGGDELGPGRILLNERYCSSSATDHESEETSTSIHNTGSENPGDISDLSFEHGARGGYRPYLIKQESQLDTTYRLKRPISAKEEARFDKTRVQGVIREVLESKIVGLKYEHEKCKEMSEKVSEDVRERLKVVCGDEGPLKVTVYTFISEILGVDTCIQCSWDRANDCVVCGYYKTSSVMAMVVTFITYSPLSAGSDQL